MGGRKMRSKALYPPLLFLYFYPVRNTDIADSGQDFDLSVKIFIVKDSLHFAHVKIVAMRLM